MSAPLAKWRKKHPQARVKIDSAIARLTAGNTSSIKWLSGRAGIGEYRINWGPGIRLYLMQDGYELIILLCAGDKSTQDKDLDNAQQYRSDYLIEKRGK
ncbi:type II toxin-antitoxin system RelE/ParE family toxin [Winslowiella arboricola]|uniref:type II toxin-antitoxin system RelE/ParE family toxin n=1 Tax=Winslowiella arboricola TaxID=2978220 RepID=UPI00389A8567